MRKVLVLCGILVGVLVLTTATWAQDEETNYVGIGGYRLMRVAPAHGYPLPDRIQILQQRLINILTVLRKDEDPQVVIKQDEWGNPSIWVKGMLFVTVTSRDCELHSSSPDALAATWAKNIDKVLRQVAPSVSPKH